MKIKVSLFLLAVLFSLTTNTLAEPDPNFYIFLCFGQSNMEGFPGIEEQDKIAVDQRFQVLASVDFPNLGRTKGNWYEAVPPLCRGNCGICPADYFGRTMVANLPEEIRVGVVNVSVAGCKIELFEKDTFQMYASTAPGWMANIIKQYNGNPYQYLVDMAKLAQKDGVIKGILLHQGESNTNDNEWPAKVKGIYDNLIKDLSLKAEDVPLLAGELVNADQGGACASMNAIIAELPQTIPNAHVISSTGCISRPDHLHFTPAGYRQLGKRYAEKMLSLLGYEMADPLELTVHTDQTAKTISAGIYGQFLEHIFNSVHGGLWGDQILNGTLELRPPRRRRGGMPDRGVLPTPQHWEFIGDSSEVAIDRDNPFNAEVSVRIAPKGGGDSTTGPGIRQQNIALEQGEKYTLSLYARGSGSVVVTFTDKDTPVFSQTFTGLTAQWQKFTVEFTVSSTVDASTLMISSSISGSVNVDQISLFSASALATGGYLPDLFKAVADLQPASIRWPGGSFANHYIWQNGIGPRDKRLPHPIDQWGDRDTYQFGTDEFIQLCEKVGAEPILVLNTSRGVEDALDWLEYCMGDETTEYGKMRADNGRPEPYQLKTLEIDNEPWLMMDYPKYLEIVQQFCPAIRAMYPSLKLSVAGSYGYDTGPGEGNQEANRNWDPRIIAEAGTLFDILSPHYYNGIYFAADYVDDPYNYEQFLKGRGDIIRNSENPDMKIYVSEWNLTEKAWGNDWRVGLYAGGILNAFERQGDIVTMSCPALFMRRQGVTTSWDNALINFDQKSWFPGGNYVVMKLWRDSFAPNMLVVDGPNRPLNVVATRSEDQTVFIKAVNPTGEAIAVAVRLDGDLTPGSATMQLIAPGGERVKNTLEEPDNIKVLTAVATVEGQTVTFTMPPLSAGVVRVMP
ncbi:carbohydrate binding domain-containing protein [candidate division KSB1 bacterium]|nr:carbohydrate binding domain-containing protein [candidate division KSB1 bacterium]